MSVGRMPLVSLTLKNYCYQVKFCCVRKYALRLRTPDTVERPWLDLASGRRISLPLLGERVGVRAGVSAHLKVCAKTKSDFRAEFQHRPTRHLRLDKSEARNPKSETNSKSEKA